MLVSEGTIQIIANVIKRDGAIELPAQGNSMFPLIKEGNICRFDSCTKGAMKKGDIILFRTAAGRVVAHRFYKTVSINNRMYYLFKGDTNLDFDEPVECELVIGRLAFIRKSKLNIHAGNLAANLWGRLILSFPILSHLLRLYLNKKENS